MLLAIPGMAGMGEKKVRQQPQGLVVAVEEEDSQILYRAMLLRAGAVVVGSGYLAREVMVAQATQELLVKGALVAVAALPDQMGKKGEMLILIPPIVAGLVVHMGEAAAAAACTMEELTGPVAMALSVPSGLSGALVAAIRRTLQTSN